MSESVDHLDAVLDVCRTRRQRIVLAVVSTEGRTLTTDDLTKTIARIEHDAPLSDLSGEVLTGIQLSLYHRILPKLATDGFVEYDLEQQLVRPTCRLDQSRPILTRILQSCPDLDGECAL